MEMVMVDERREGDTQSLGSKNSPTLKLRSSLGSKKKNKIKTIKSSGARLACHFVFGSHQSKAPLFCTLATRNSNTYPSRHYLPSVLTSVRAGMEGLEGEGWRAVAGIPDPTLSAQCGHDLQESLAEAAPAAHQIHTHLWAAIIWRYIKRYLFPLVGLLTVGRVKVKAGSDTMIHTAQLKDSLHLN